MSTKAMAAELMQKRRQLPKLMACMTKTSLENMRNKTLFNMEVLDAKQIRRVKLPFHECLICELRESGYVESADYLQDLIYDNMQLIADDEIGIVVDLRKRKDYLEHVCEGLQRAEREKDRDQTKCECLELLQLALFYSNQGKGILWLPEKLFLACIAVSSKYLVDGGRLKAVCKFHYAKFLLDKSGHELKTAEAVVEMGICQLSMHNLNNALKTLQRAFKINTKVNNIEGLCDTRMHLAAVLQKLGDHEGSAEMLTAMGALAMENNLRRHLGRALHLLGELHLRREKPELGTQHLAEAFHCFMGTHYETDMNRRGSDVSLTAPDMSRVEVIFKRDPVVYIEEAEQSRLMMAVSEGQELMSSYFNLIRQGGICAVARMKHIQWKLSRVGWWIELVNQETLACPCPAHHRTPIDIFRNEIAKKEARRMTTTVELALNKSPALRAQLNIHGDDPIRKSFRIQIAEPKA